MKQAIEIFNKYFSDEEQEDNFLELKKGRNLKDEILKAMMEYAEQYKLPENISKEELEKLSALKELYLKYTNEGVNKLEFGALKNLAFDLNFCFGVKCTF